MITKIKILLSSVLLIISAQAISVASDHTGQYRGLLELAPNVSIVLGIEIKQSGDEVQVLLDSPNQGMHNKPVNSHSLADNKLNFTVEDLNASFSGSFESGTLTGVFSQGRKFPIELKQLRTKDLAKLENERRWFGDLMVSPSSKLPLIVNVAVLPDDYHVTLDSPQQQSFSIPVNDFKLNNSKMSFNVDMINASYEAQWQDKAWVGTFVQGAAMPLTLKKKPNK